MNDKQEVMNRSLQDVSVEQAPSTESKPAPNVLPVSAVASRIRQDALADSTSYVENVKARKGGE